MTVRLLVIMMILYLLLMPVSAQNTRATCRYTPPNSVVLSVDGLTFEDCVTAIYNEIRSRAIDEAYAFWGDIIITVDSQGEIYYDQNPTRVEWKYWGTVASSPPPLPTPDITPTSTNDRWVIENLVEVAAADINDFWAQSFSTNGILYEAPALELYRARIIRSGCGRVDADAGPLYCRLDHTIYLPRDFMIAAQEYIGDFAVAAIVAHEWGHAVQELLGISEDVEQSQSSVNLEIQADCLAGAYAAYAANISERVSLDPGDIEEGADQLYAVGESDSNPLQIWLNPIAHGTPEQREEAYYNGFTNGGGACE